MKIHRIWTLVLASACTATAGQQGPAANAVSFPLADAAGALRLDDVLRQALERSPEVAGAQATIRAMQHRVPQSRALPDPTVSAGWAGKPAPFNTMAGDPSSYRGVTVSEQFPYPGKLKLQGEVAARDVEAAQVDCEAARRRLVLGVRSAFAEYFFLTKAIDAARQNKQLLEKLAAIAEAQYRVGKAMQQDVLRAQLEISMLMEKQATLEEQRNAAMASLNEALQQTPETPLAPPEELEARPIRYSLDALYALADEHDTGVSSGQTAIERGKLSVALAERQFRPDFGVSYMFQQRTNQPDMNGVTVSVSVPLFQKSKQREAVAEAAEMLHTAEKMRDSRKNTLRAEVRRQYVAAQNAQHLLELYSKGIVPQSSLALESAMSSYQVGKLDFLALIASFSTLLNYETDTYRQMADYQMAVARIESLTGEPIVAESGTTQPAAADQNGAR